MAARLQVANATRGVVLATACRRADSHWSRLVGLLGRSKLAPGEGLYVVPCKSAHTWFMRFAIDAVYIDREQRVVKTAQALRPFRVSWGGRAAHSVLELPAGTIAATGTAPGDQLALAEE